MLGNRAGRAFGLFIVGVVAVLIATVDSGAGAASLCARAQAPNALVTTSADGSKVYGSSCSDRIVVTSPLVREVVAGEGNDVVFANPNVEVVNGGEGDDAIYGELPEIETGPARAGVVYQSKGLVRRTTGAEPVATASIEEKKCEAGKSCYGGIGSQKLVGSGGNDKVFGQRGNDEIFGNAGNDELFGGIGDESLISGGAGNDLLSGGLGADRLNGNEDSDLVRGDGTIDTIEDTGPSGTDTLSFSTGVTPGFTGGGPVAGFPGEGEERGVSVRIDGLAACGSLQACNNSARYGGGNDEISVSGFENLIGSPFADYIIGSNGANRIDGGGGTDVILGNGGDDTIYGGADGDYLKGDAGTDTAFGQGGTNHCASDAETQLECSGTTESVVQRNTGKISAGFIATESATSWVELYLTGSTGVDRVSASFGFEGAVGYVTFATEGESAQFDVSGDAATAGCTYEATKVKCILPKKLDSIAMAGMAGNDRLALNVSEQSWETTTPILLGGEGNDEILGSGYTEDLLVDGNDSGGDVLKAFAYDDGLLNNEGADTLEGGNGNDLLVSSGTCEGDTLQGAESGTGDGAAQNNASFAQVPAGAPGVVADLESEGELKGTAGNVYSSGPACSSGSLNKLRNTDDLEATNGNDILYGDNFENNLLGRSGKDQIWARGGVDNLEAKDGEADEGGGGAGTDTCSLDAKIDTFASCP
jgi:Ca2+-binding RTX toxin-like protein